MVRKQINHSISEDPYELKITLSNRDVQKCSYTLRGILLIENNNVRTQ